MTQENPRKLPKTWGYRQQQLHKSIQDYTLMDDLFMSTVLTDPLACQHVLRILLQEPDLIVQEVVVQKTMPQLYGKSPRLDVTAETTNGCLMNIEVQQQEEPDYGRRLRFYTGTMVSKLLERGQDYNRLPDQIMIYISSSDIWHRGRTIYEFQMMEIQDAFPADDGLRQIYVNTEIHDGSAIAQLMAYFKTADPLDMSQGDLAKRVHFYKVEQEGVRFMSSLSQRLYDLGSKSKAKQLVQNMYQLGMPIPNIAEITKETEETIQAWISESVEAESYDSSK